LGTTSPLRPKFALRGEVKNGTQGCQMVFFLTKNQNVVIFWRALEWKMQWIQSNEFGIYNYKELLFKIE
jgi:hypothetical protein